MITVDLYVPIIYQNYNFQLSESAEIALLIEEISEMISFKEHSPIVGDINKLLLCDKINGRVLEKNRTLSECGITTGSSLILV